MELLALSLLSELDPDLLQNALCCVNTSHIIPLDTYLSTFSYKKKKGRKEKQSSYKLLQYFIAAILK